MQTETTTQPVDSQCCAINPSHPHPTPDARLAVAFLDSTNQSYARLKPADAVAHLNERLAAEVERFEKDTGLRLASVKVTRDKETDDLKQLKAHVR